MTFGIYGSVFFTCEKRDLTAVAEIISERLTSKNDSFGGFENYIRDEVPTVYTDDLLGLRIIVMQNPDETDQFAVEVLDRIHQYAGYEEPTENQDISLRIRMLLNDCESFRFMDDDD
ncbi:hypothetical protein SAMN04488505_101481 [Chitinophaga rupis]|uniref:Uncharacterized protein n=1 Tax=Chitinophaga rupis TaxID=573321 RepID=A0A1H7I7J1_9BACT|nr:hypothetical protein [Chitinophaga rupis]SEK58398.1 hypothetical protein SAMN04488505_101481 [Chitinophaga rupis]